MALRLAYCTFNPKLLDINIKMGDYCRGGNPEQSGKMMV
jgi:hypothetical protein